MCKPDDPHYMSQSNSHPRELSRLIQSVEQTTTQASSAFAFDSHIMCPPAADMKVDLHGQTGQVVPTERQVGGQQVHSCPSDHSSVHEVPLSPKRRRYKRETSDSSYDDNEEEEEEEEVTAKPKRRRRKSRAKTHTEARAIDSVHERTVVHHNYHDFSMYVPPDGQPMEAQLLDQKGRGGTFEHIRARL